MALRNRAGHMEQSGGEDSKAVDRAAVSEPSAVACAHGAGAPASSSAVLYGPVDDGGGGGGSSIGASGSDFSQPPPQPPQAACHDPGAMVEGDAGPSLLDPGAFECPCGPCEYDCQKRAPVRSACACKRLLCRKCAGVAASLPGPAPCGLCGAEAVGPFEAGEFVLDAGVLLTLMGRLETREPYVGGELADAQCLCFVIPRCFQLPLLCDCIGWQAPLCGLPSGWGAGSGRVQLHGAQVRPQAPV